MKSSTAFALGMTFAAVALVLADRLPIAEAQGSKWYRVIDENNGGKIERDLNDIVRSDPTCRPILTIGANGDYGKSKVIVECGAP